MARIGGGGYRSIQVMRFLVAIVTKPWNAYCLTARKQIDSHRHFKSNLITKVVAVFTFGTSPFDSKSRSVSQYHAASPVGAILTDSY